MWPLLLALPLIADARPKSRAPATEEVAADLIGRALASSEPWDELGFLTDRIGARISGSPQLERAVQWGAEEMRRDGLKVTLEEVMVPNWVRHREEATVRWESTAGVTDARDLSVMALGGTVTTPEDGITAEVLVVSSYEELNEKSALAKGRIVLFDVPFTDYGSTVSYRYSGADAASAHGAVASLVRSVSPESLHTLHTGQMGYRDESVPQIPHAAITVEDAAWLHRLQDAGVTPTVTLHLQARYEDDALSHNVVGEIRGRSKPEEVIVLGCHLDSWDVGTGAQDDGAGCVTVMQAGALLAALPHGPARTVRVVLYTNEENGLRGGKAYAEAHAGERIVAAIEDDTGAGRPLGFSYRAMTAEGEMDEARNQAVGAWLSPVADWLAPLDATLLEPGYAGADINPMLPSGTIGLGLRHDMSGYWRVHHTEADTLDKIDPMMVRRNAAVMTAMAWFLSESPSYPER